MGEMQKQSHFDFLSLPLELRCQIYNYVLPYTLQDLEEDVPEWRMGYVSILGTNKQIHLEAIALLYGNSTFSLQVGYDRIRWLEFPRGYASPLNVVAPKSISRIRRVSVFIKLPGTDDEGRWVSNQANISYHSYNDTFEGCLNAMEGQMSALFTVLRQIKEIQDLEMFMWLDIPQPHKRCDRKLLSPLLSLENVRKGSLFGDISPEFEQEVQDHFRSSAAKS